MRLAENLKLSFERVGFEFLDWELLSVKTSTHSESLVETEWGVIKSRDRVFDHSALDGVRTKTNYSVSPKTQDSYSRGQVEEVLQPPGAQVLSPPSNILLWVKAVLQPAAWDARGAGKEGMSALLPYGRCLGIMGLKYKWGKDTESNDWWSLRAESCCCAAAKFPMCLPW